MKFTCLSKGKGFYFPPCYIIDVCGFRILFDCPLDLSCLAIFSPVPYDSCAMLAEETSSCSNHRSLSQESVDPKRQKLEEPLNASHLIRAEPWYKTVTNLHLWDISFIDIVLISSPMGMLGLPFLTRTRGFCAKIYMTEVALRIGKLMMEDLLSMHKEFRDFYGPGESSFPQWMKWEELELLSTLLREIALGQDGTELGGWLSLYSAADMKDCIQKVETLHYAEETCYNGVVVIKAYSSGLEIGSCNWLISCPQGNIVSLSSSISASAHAMDFNYQALQGKDLIIYSDFSFLNVIGKYEDGISSSVLSDDTDELEALNKILRADDVSEEEEKLTDISSLVVDSVKSGGSVIISIGRIGIILHLLEYISSSLEALNLKVPIFMISSIAEELLALTNTIPEWLCNQRQEKMYLSESLFAHVELMKDKRLHLFPTIYSHELLKTWQEPCIVFSPHWSLRLGPTVHLLRRWCGDYRSLLVMEEVMNVSMALLPFEPRAMKVHQCSFSFFPGKKLHKIQQVLKILQPKSILMPEELKHLVLTSKASSFSLFHYSENNTLDVPNPKEDFEVKIAAELAHHLRFKPLNEESIPVARLSGELSVRDSKYWLVAGNEQED